MRACSDRRSAGPCGDSARSASSASAAFRAAARAFFACCSARSRRRMAVSTVGVRPSRSSPVRSSSSQGRDLLFEGGESGPVVGQLALRLRESGLGRLRRTRRPLCQRLRLDLRPGLRLDLRLGLRLDLRLGVGVGVGIRVLIGDSVGPLPRPFVRLGPSSGRPPLGCTRRRRCGRVPQGGRGVVPGSGSSPVKPTAAWGAFTRTPPAQASAASSSVRTA